MSGSNEDRIAHLISTIGAKVLPELRDNNKKLRGIRILLLCQLLGFLIAITILAASVVYIYR